MHQQELEDWFVATLADFKLSQSEALELRNLISLISEYVFYQEV